MVALMLFPLPMLALTVRRLHDIDESGWFVVIALVPLGVFVLFPVMLLPGSEEVNRFG
ncbi:Inner membrane protein YhaI [compost metagenome]